MRTPADKKKFCKYTTNDGICEAFGSIELQQVQVCDATPVDKYSHSRLPKNSLQNAVPYKPGLFAQIALISALD